MTLRDVLEELRPLATPSEEQRRRINTVVEGAVNRLRRAAKQLGLCVDIEVHGSVAHDTWLPRERDIDVFLLFNRELGRERIVELGVRLGRKAFRRYVERFSEHPYITALYRGYRVDVVPAAKISRAEERLTAADRTPLHTKYLLTRLDERLRSDIRLLKMLLRNTGLYGAEIRVQGFSGYLSELLIVSYGGFEELLRAAATRWAPYKTVIQLDAEAGRTFAEPLVVVDPVDPNRNVASSLSLDNMGRFILLAKLLLKHPSKHFFLGRPRPYSPRSLEKQLRLRGAHLVVVEAKCPTLPPDILWGELKRSLAGLERWLNRHGYAVMDSDVWVGGSKMFFAFEVGRTELPRLRPVQGPPVGMHSESDEFIDVNRHVWVKGGRLWAYKRRRSAHIKEALLLGVYNASLARDVRASLKGGFRVYLDKTALERLYGERELRISVSEFILKVPWWVRRCYG